MSATTSEIKKRYERIEPSAALLRRTERMMAEENEKKKSRVFARRIAAAAISMALICVLIAVFIFPRTEAKDHVQPLAAVTLPEQNDDGRSFTLHSSSQSLPADSKNVSPAEGVTLEITNISAEGDEIFAAWTVRSTLQEAVYYALEYEIVFDNDIPADYQLSGSGTRTIDCFFSNEDMLLPEVPALFALTPENPEYSGSFLHGYSASLPECEVSVIFTLYAYVAKGEVDWGEQDETTAYQEFFSQKGQYPGAMGVYAGAKDVHIIKNAAYLQTLSELETQNGPRSANYLDALTESGMMVKLFSETHEYRCREESKANSLILTEMEAKLPRRTVNVRSFSITPDTLELRYTVTMDKLEYTEGSAGLTEDILFYVMDDEGKFISSAADGNTFNAGFFSHTPFKGESGKQAYDCWLRLDIALDEMPEYFIFAPHGQETGQYTGTKAERFERLYSLTAPEECFAISPDSGIIILEGRTQSTGGVSFTLDKTKCTNGLLEIEWTVESTLGHDIFYFVESNFVPADGVWAYDSGSGSYTDDYYSGWNLFGIPGKLLTPQNPTCSGSLTQEFTQDTPCPGGVMHLTVHAFRAADGGSISEYQETLMEFNSYSSDDPDSYIALIKDSGLFIEETSVSQSFDVPPFEDSSKVLIENVQFDFDGKTIMIRNLRVTPAGMDMRYEISGADFSEYSGEHEYEDMYFAVTAYGSEVGLGHLNRSASTDSMRCGTITESDWNLEKVPEYIVLVPYGKMSYEEYMDLRKSRGSGEMYDRLREMYYKDADQSECIRIYMDGRVTTNEMENRQDIPTRTIEPTPPLSTLSEPIGSTLSEPVAPLQAEIVSDSEMRFPQKDRTIVVNHAGIDDGCISVSSLTEEESIFHINYTVYAPMDGEYGKKDGWKFDYFPVLPDGTLADHSTGYGMILTDENGDICVPQSSMVIFPKDDIPEYITFVPWQHDYLDSELSLEEKDSLMQEDADAADPAQCFRLMINKNGAEYVFTIEALPVSTSFDLLSSTLSEPLSTGKALLLPTQVIRLEHAKVNPASLLCAASYDDSMIHMEFKAFMLQTDDLGINDGWKGSYFPLLPDGTLPPDHASGYASPRTEGGNTVTYQTLDVYFQGKNVPEYLTLVPWQRDYYSLSVDEKRAAMLEDAASADPADCFRLYIESSESDEETDSNAYRFFIGPDRIEGPYTYGAVYDTPSGEVGIIRSQIEDGNQYISYSYPVDADRYDMYLDMDNYSGLYFAAMETSSGSVSFINGHKGITTVNGMKYWQGVIMSTLPLDGADEIMLIPYPDGFNPADLIAENAQGTNDVLLAGIYESTAPEEIIRIPIDR